MLYRNFGRGPLVPPSATADVMRQAVTSLVRVRLKARFTHLLPHPPSHAYTLAYTLISINAEQIPLNKNSHIFSRAL